MRHSHLLSRRQFVHFNSSVEVSIPEKPSKPGEPIANVEGIAYIEGYNVNLRKGPGASYSVISQLNKPESYKVWGEKDGWLNLGGNQRIKYNPSYVKFEKKEPVNLIAGKRVVSKVDNLRFYDSPSWADRDVAGTVDEGLGFQIIDKVSVNGSQQYKVKNNRGNVYYITASSYYVKIK